MLKPVCVTIFKENNEIYDEDTTQNIPVRGSQKIR